MSDFSSQFDANSEKEQGNEYFKQKKFNEAIDCYSRSIALSPNAVAFANRAMAYLKLKRLAEADCTEVLNLDDRYIKAYSRRATARKQLGMIKEAKEDAEFALRLEPESQELKKQYADIKSLLEKEIIERATGAMQSTAEELLKTAGLEKKTKTSNTEMKMMKTQGAKTNGDTARPVSGSKEVSGKKLIESVQPEEKKNEVSKKMTLKSEGYEKEAKSYGINGTQPSGSGNQVSRKLELKPSVQELGARAASLAMAEVSKNVRVPKSAYEFENSWRSFSGDRALQTQLLKVTTPSSLPQIFKSALTSPVLFDIIKCVASFFNEDMDFAVKYIENLTKMMRQLHAMYGEWLLKDGCWNFVVDHFKGAIMFLSEGSTHADFVAMTQEDYNLDMNTESVELTIPDRITQRKRCTPKYIGRLFIDRVGIIDGLNPQHIKDAMKNMFGMTLDYTTSYRA
ncbi:hypothetical protein F2Q68_00031382, partial [Brassica cretica]